MVAMSAPMRRGGLSVSPHPGGTTTMRKLSKRLALAALLATFAVPAAVAQLGPPAGSIYASDRLFHTIGTPTDLPNKGQFNAIYTFSGGLASVAEAAPGERTYRGGRWEVHEV